MFRTIVKSSFTSIYICINLSEYGGNVYVTGRNIMSELCYLAKDKSYVLEVLPLPKLYI